MDANTMTLVLLPGLNGTANLFQPLLDTAPKNFNPLCIVYPTHQVKTYPELLNQVLAELNRIEGDYLLLGESFSGPIAVMIRHRSPKGLRGVILSASFVNAPTVKIMRFLPWKLLFILFKKLSGILFFLFRPKPTSLFRTLVNELTIVSPNVFAARIKQAFSINVENELREGEIPIMYFYRT